MTKHKIFQQFCISCMGEENIEFLKSLREQLSSIRGKSLGNAYRMFGITPSEEPVSQDVVRSVELVHTTKAGRLTQGHFFFTTETLYHRHCELWVTLCENLSNSSIGLTVMGTGCNGENFCEDLLVPASLQAAD